MIVLMVMYVAFSLFSALLALPLIARKIKPNGLYGFRIPRTMENPPLWYAVNAHFGWRMLVTGLVTALAAVILYVIPGISLDGYAMGVMAVFVLCFGIGVTQSWRYMNRLSPTDNQRTSK